MIDFIYILKLLQVLGLILVQAGYDFLGWKVLLGGHDSGRKSEKVFRVIKLILDFPVTIWFAIWILKFPFTEIWIFNFPLDLLWFYLLKWVHSADRTYNWYDKLVYNQKPAYWGYWRFWTLWWGILRTNWFNKIHIIKGYTYKDYVFRTGFFKDYTAEIEKDNLPKLSEIQELETNFKGMKGMVNINEVNKVNNFFYGAFFIYYIAIFFYKNLGG